jgi:nucleoside-diphosphate-sugar epimerase
VTDGEKFRKYVEESKSDTVIHLAAILSALGEKNPQRALDVNVKSTICAINIANDNHCRLFIPSSIASFGGNSF